MVVNAEFRAVVDRQGLIYYEIWVTNESGREWRIDKQFADFQELDRNLQADGNLHRIPLPNMGVFGVRHGLRLKRFLHCRKERLNRYLTHLCGQIQCVRQNEVLGRFLEGDIPFVKGVILELAGSHDQEEVQHAIDSAIHSFSSCTLLEHSLKARASTLSVESPRSEADGSHVFPTLLQRISIQSISSIESCTRLRALTSLQRGDVEVKENTECQLHQRIEDECKRWEASDRDGIGVAKRALELLKDASGGALLVIAPKGELKKLRVKSVDRNYMDTRLIGEHISSSKFEKAFLEFASHSPEFDEGDRWPQTYYDVAARRLPKDGCTLLDAHGFVAKGGAKILHCTADVNWPEHGTRHEAALGVAAVLSKGIVLIKSSAGKINVLCAGENGETAYELSDKAGRS